MAKPSSSTRRKRIAFLGASLLLSACSAPYSNRPSASKSRLGQESGASESSRANAGGASPSDSESLSSKAVDPTASLLGLNFVGDYTGSYHGNAAGLDGDATELEFKPVIPFKLFGVDNIMRMTLPYHIDGRGQDGLGDMTIFDLAVIHEDWGRWGVGPVMTFAGDKQAPDQFVIGPAIGGVASLSKRLKLGLFNQNVFGDTTSISQLQPIVAYQLGSGWALTGGDLQYVYDWERSRWLSIPLGFQIGKVLVFGGQPMRLAINPQYNLTDGDGLFEWKILFTFTLFASE